MTAPSGLTIDDVTVCYRRQPAVHHVAARFPFGSLVAVMGPNGSGKSTLLRAILGLQPLTTGAFTIDGRPAAEAAARIAYLPQRAQIDWDFPILVRDVVMMGRYRRVGVCSAFTAEDDALVQRALDEMGIASIADRQIGMLSGGQQQRVFLARAVASGADIFLLDEPFAGLDLRSTGTLAALLRGWADQGRLVVAVVHDVALAKAWFTHALLLRTHLVAAGAVASVLDEMHLSEAFGAAVPAAVRL